MGGDRDGNPNVTANITRHVLLLSRWKATDLFLKDIQFLISELSMVDATPELLALVGEEGAAEPYRYLMKTLRSRLMATQARLEARLKGEKLPKPAGLLTQNEQLWDPLYACYQSLQACGMGIIANGELLDTLRRVKCFGVPLVRIDIRQESTRHTEALGELTRYLGIGDYENWSEADKQAFLIRELNSSVRCSHVTGSRATTPAKCSTPAGSLPKPRMAPLPPMLSQWPKHHRMYWPYICY